MKNRNLELAENMDARFDFEAYDADRQVAPVEEYENPYEDYDLWDVEITESVKKVIHVGAKDAKSAKEYVESQLDSIDMSKDIEEYKKTVIAIESGGSDADMTVPLWWYGGE